MKYLSPEIARMAKKVPEKNLIKKSNSCGIFQDIGKDPHMKSFRQKYL